MNKKEEIKKAIKDLNNEYSKIWDWATEAGGYDYYDDEIFDFNGMYQEWYTKALSIVKLLGKDRLDEFKNCYQSQKERSDINIANYTISDYIKGIKIEGENEKGINEVLMSKLDLQSSILSSLESRIDSIYDNLENIILIDIQNKELEIAEKLINTSLRAAGSLAGVVLENHIQKVISNHDEIEFKKSNPSINELNEILYKNKIITSAQCKKIQYLGDIRNLCAHKKDEEPKSQQVRNLISGVNEIVKNVF